MKARWPEMAAILRAYEGRKLPRLTLPVSAFGKDMGVVLDTWRRDEPITVEGVRGRIVGWAVVVELESPAEDAPPDHIEGQEGFLIDGHGSGLPEGTL